MTSRTTELDAELNRKTWPDNGRLLPAAEWLERTFLQLRG